MLTKTPNIDNLIEEALAGESERTARILSERFGLNSSRPKTLAEIGNSYGVTRERIRQIEEVALENLREKVREAREAARFLELVESYLENVGNLRRSDLLVRDLMMLWNPKSAEPVFSNRLHFLAEVLGEPTIAYGDNDWHDVWHNDEEAYELAKKVTQELLKAKDHDFDKFLESTALRFELPTFLVINYVTISKHFGVGPYGDLGAKTWVHVNPKTVRDRSYLILKRVGAPLHFKEIAGLINKIGDKRKVHQGTVHNELIKDRRFVWVKRGTYGLKEHLKK